MASGGLQWACGSIVQLVHLLVHGPNNAGGANNESIMYGNNGGSNSDGSHSHHHIFKKVQAERMEDIMSKTIQARLLLLIDLVY